MIRRPPRSTLGSSAASDVYKRQAWEFGMDVTENLLFGSALLSGAALWAFVRERRRSFIQSRVIAATNSGVLVTDASVPRHPIIQANPAFRLLTGYAESEVLGQSTHLLNGAHTDRTAIEKIGLALQDSRACRVTIRHYRKNGTPFWNEVTLSPVCLLYTSPSPRDRTRSRMPSSA